MDDVQSLNISLRQPFKSLLIVGYNRLEAEGSVFIELQRGQDALINNTQACHFITPVIKGIKECFSRVHTRSKELHLLAHAHRGNTAGNSCVIAPVAADILIGLILDSRSINRDLGAEPLIPFGKLRIPENGDIRLRPGPKMVESQGIKQTERGFGNQGTPVIGKARI